MFDTAGDPVTPNRAHSDVFGMDTERRLKIGRLNYRWEIEI
jgi:hypothetical protein